MKISNNYKLIALSSLLGTGGVEAKVYYNPDEKKIILFLFDPVTKFKDALGPMDIRVIETIENVLKDVNDMKGKPIAYIEE